MLIGDVGVDVVGEVHVAIGCADDQSFENSEDGLPEREGNLRHDHPTSFN